MTLQEIASFINQNGRFKLISDQLVLLIDSVQKLAFDYDMQGFKFWDNTQQIYVEIEFASAGYTNAITGDVGKAVVGGTSATSGTLISFNNTTRKWVVDIGSTLNYTAGEAITITTGTGAGTLLAIDAQVNFKGPYSWGSLSPVARKMIGMTTFTDPRIFGTEAVFEDDLNDFGLVFDDFDERRFFRNARLDIFAKTLTFINEPNRTDDVHRWVYFRKPDTITDLLAASDSKMIIPEEYHMNLIQACIEQQNVSTEDGAATRNHIESHFHDWWQQVRKAFTPMGRTSNQVNEGVGNTRSYMV